MKLNTALNIKYYYCVFTYHLVNKIKLLILAINMNLLHSSQHCCHQAKVTTSSSLNNDMKKGLFPKIILQFFKLQYFHHHYHVSFLEHFLLSQMSPLSMRR